MLSGKEYLEGIDMAIKEDIETELQRLQYFIKANARMKNARFPFPFPVKNCRLEVIDALAIYLEENSWSVEKNKEYIYITPIKIQEKLSTLSNQKK
jgi:hypothetical protein